MKKTNIEVNDSDEVEVTFTNPCDFKGQAIVADDVRTVTIAQAKILKSKQLIEEY